MTFVFIIFHVFLSYPKNGHHGLYVLVSSKLPFATENNINIKSKVVTEDIPFINYNQKVITDKYSTEFSRNKATFRNKSEPVLLVYVFHMTPSTSCITFNLYCQNTCLILPK